MSNLLKYATVFCLAASAFAQEDELRLEDSSLVNEGRAFLTGGQIFLNGTTAVVIGILAAAAIAAATALAIAVLYGLLGGEGATSSGYGSYGNSYGYGYNQRADSIFSRRQDMLEGFTDKLYLLADAFKKYGTNETGCQLYVACEAGNVATHDKNGALAKTVHSILSEIKSGNNEEFYKDDQYMKDLMSSFELGQLGTDCYKFKSQCKQKNVFY